jgi:hypothetical protein
MNVDVDGLDAPSDVNFVVDLFCLLNISHKMHSICN